jgi:hypothetical protein
MNKEPMRSKRGRRKSSSPDDGQDKRPRTTSPETVEPIAPVELLPGSVFRVPDKFWGFEAVDRVEHPGLCTSCPPRIPGKAEMLKGTGALSASWRPTYFVEPSTSNGLKKWTAFELVPFRFPIRRVQLMHPQRWMGRLDDEDFRAIQRELERIFPAWRRHR